MKRLICLLLTCLFICQPVFADVLFEPEDSFYKRHAEECEPLNKFYTSEHEVNVYKNPESSKALDTAQSGSIFYLEWVYTDENGAQWGLYENDEVSYWVNMAELEPVYSHDEFTQQHQNEITVISETVDTSDSGYVIFYEYPNSTWISDIMNTDWFESGSLSVSLVYVDEDGTCWGYTPYFMMASGWVNLDKSVSETEPVRNSFEIYVPENTSSSTLMITMLVCTVCIITGLAALLLFRKKR